MTNNKLLIGVDIGGTKTRIRAFNQVSQREEQYVSAQWRQRNWEDDAIAILRMASQIADGAPIAAMGIGAHGCDDEAECSAFQTEFEKHASFPVRVVNDAELMPLGLGFSHQIGLVAGTGSIAVCRNPAGAMLTAGGWGWVIGDEGSAAGLVREAARSIALYLDEGGAANEPLCELLFQALDIPSLPRIGSTIVGLGNAAMAGQHAHVIFEAAERGSQVARSVINDGGAALADLVCRLRKRGARAEHVVAGGSVIVGQPMLWSAFETELDRLTNGEVIAHLFDGQPVEGACRLAESLISKDFLDVGPQRAPIHS